jgi:hypothetical protein
MMDPRKPSLDQQLAGLSRDVAPPEALWQGIDAALTRHRTSRQVAYGLCAAAACALLGSALTWFVLRTPGASIATRGTTPGGAPGIAVTAAADPQAFGEPADPAYRAARLQLETTFRERLALLPPQTRAEIEANLAAIRQAHENIRKALAAAPTNPVLAQLFESTWRAEFDLYDRVVQTTQPDLARTHT